MMKISLLSLIFSLSFQTLIAQSSSHSFEIIQFDLKKQELYEPFEFVQFIMNIDAGIRSGLLFPYSPSNTESYHELSKRISLEKYLSYLENYPMDIFDLIYESIPSNEWPDIEAYMLKERNIEYFLPTDPEHTWKNKQIHPIMPICSKIIIVLEHDKNCTSIRSILFESKLDPDLGLIGVRYEDAKKFIDNWESKYYNFRSEDLERRILINTKQCK